MTDARTPPPRSPAVARAAGGLRFQRRLVVRLVGLLLAAIVLIFALVAYWNVRLHRRHLEAGMQVNAERVSDVIKRSTSYHMLRNDREALYQIMRTVGAEPGIVRLRIFNQQGQISFSTDAGEIGRYVQQDAEACHGCHAQGKPLSHLNRPDRFRVFRSDGARLAGVINPIENRIECWSAPCHAHPPQQKILGVLDTTLTLAQTDAALAQSSRQMLAAIVLGAALISLTSGLFVWRMVGRPLRALHHGTEALAEGELGYQIQVPEDNEIGELAASFNHMSRELEAAHAAETAWSQQLEERVEEKTSQLKAAHQQMLRAEKLASMGKLAATVAHEINNPLSGVLTYAKLVRKWLERGEPDEARRQEMRQALELIESETRRCGDIVKTMLAFARSAPMNLEWADLNAVFERVVRLVQHKLELAGIQLRLELEPGLPRAQCDPAQLEQVLLALVMNAFEAMPRGGTLTLRSRLSQADAGALRLEVQDDGLGIPPDVLPRLFEPFVTTKEGHAVGLGLAISRQIMERHNGRIEVESEAGRGSRFSVLLPASAVENPSAAVPLSGTGKG